MVAEMASLLRGCYVCVLIFVLREVSSLEYSGPISSDSKIRLDGGLRRFRRQNPQVQNATTVKDNHVYYTSKFYPSNSAEASQIWFDVAKQSGIEVIVDHSISSNFRVFNIMQLPFDFLFYGHTINQVAITTAGFLYTSDYFHSRIYLTQYIAPLQADFNPGLNDSARILIYNHTERFTVQWDSVHVTNHVENGTFTFQVSLFPNGSIHFAYRQIPLPQSAIDSPGHPVRVGLADSFYVDRPLRANLILRQVFEYSNIELEEEDLSYSAYVLDPVQSCVPATSCEACVVASKNSPFECGWCNTLNRCSDGVDRHRQSWVDAKCQDSSTLSCPTEKPNDTVKTGKQQRRGQSGMDGLQMFAGFFNYTHIPKTKGSPVPNTTSLKTDKPSPSPVKPTRYIADISSAFVPSTASSSPDTNTAMPDLGTQPHSTPKIPVPYPTIPSHSIPTSTEYGKYIPKSKSIPTSKPILTSKPIPTSKPISKPISISKPIPTSKPIPSEESSFIPRTVSNSVPSTKPYAIHTTEPIQSTTPSHVPSAIPNSLLKGQNTEGAIKNSDHDTLDSSEMISNEEIIEELEKEYFRDSYNQKGDNFIPKTESQYNGETSHDLYYDSMDNNREKDDYVDSYSYNERENMDTDSYPSNVEGNSYDYPDPYQENGMYYKDYSTYNSGKDYQNTEGGIETERKSPNVKNQERDPNYDSVTLPESQMGNKSNASRAYSNNTNVSNNLDVKRDNQSSQYLNSGPINGSEGGNTSDRNSLDSGPLSIPHDLAEGNGSNFSAVEAKSGIQKGSSLGVGAIIGISVFVALLLLAIGVLAGTIGAVLCYGYKKPNSKVGLFLIEHRPKARKLNKGKERYEVSSEKVILDD